MDTIYLVYVICGMDSDMVGIFSDLNIANEYAGQLDSTYESTKVVTSKIMTEKDLKFPFGTRTYSILMDKNGMCDHIEFEPNQVKFNWKDYPEVNDDLTNHVGKYRFFVTTDKGQSYACTVAQDRLKIVLKSGEWKEVGDVYDPEK